MSLLLTTTDGIPVDWEELLDWHRQRERIFEKGGRLQKFHREQMRIILLKLTQPSNEAWTWAAALRKANENMKKPAYDSHCIVCKKPAHSPKGNFNAQRVTLCERKKCIRQRRTELQRERRKQQVLPLLKQVARVKPPRPQTELAGK